MFLWRSQSWDLPWAILLKGEPGLEWRVWEQNLPQVVFSGALGSLSCLWILCGDILWFRDTGKGWVKVQIRQTRHTLVPPRGCCQSPVEKTALQEGENTPYSSPPLSKMTKFSPFFLLFPGSGRPNGYLGLIP